MNKNFLLHLIPSIPFGRWICGAVLFVILFLFFELTSPESMPPATLFFALIISYIIPIFSFITDKSLDALDDLREDLDLTDDEFALTKKTIIYPKFGGNLLAPCLGLVFAFFHQFLIFGSNLNLMPGNRDSVENFAGFIGTILIWITMTTVITALVTNARVFSNLGAKNIRIDLHQTERLLPLARVATSSTLAIIGALALFPILFFDSDTPLSGALPGFVATGIPIFVLLAVPVWPMHRRLVQAKETALGQVNALIASKSGNTLESSLDKTGIEELAPLLSYKKYLSQVSTWPFDLGAITRLALYLIIPPLTWVGAALIEKGLESVL